MWKIILLCVILVFSLVFSQVFLLGFLKTQSLSEGFDVTNENFCSHISEAITELNKTPPNTTVAIRDIKVGLEIQSGNSAIVSYLTNAKMALQTQKYADAISNLKNALQSAGCSEMKQSTPSAATTSATNTIYSSTPTWLTTTKHPYIQRAIDVLSNYPPNIPEAITNIQKALDDNMAKYKNDPSTTYIQSIHELTAALQDLQGSPIDIADSIIKLKSAMSLLNSISSETSQQNCFNQTYVNSVCPQSVIENFSVNLNSFKNANNTFVQCLETTKNNQYNTLLSKLQKIKSLINEL